MVKDVDLGHTQPQMVPVCAQGVFGRQAHEMQLLVHQLQDAGTLVWPRTVLPMQSQASVSAHSCQMLVPKQHGQTSEQQQCHGAQICLPWLDGSALCTLSILSSCLAHPLR